MGQQGGRRGRLRWMKEEEKVEETNGIKLAKKQECSISVNIIIS